MRQTKSNARQNVTKHLGARTIKIPINNVKKLTGIGFLPASEAPRKTHMAYRKKYKALILKQVPCILKYMPYIFRLSKCLKNNVLKRTKICRFRARFCRVFSFCVASCLCKKALSCKWSAFPSSEPGLALLNLVKDSDSPRNVSVGMLHLCLVQA